MLFNTEEQPEGLFRLALKKLIGASSEEETRAAILDLEESLRLILEKRDKEWNALLQEKGEGAVAYAPDLKGFATDLSREVTNAIDARIDAKIASKSPLTQASPKDFLASPEPRFDEIRKTEAGLQEQIVQLRETLKGDLKPDVRDALKKEARGAVADHMAGDDELSRMIAELVNELRTQLAAELKAELTNEVKEAIKDEIKSELRKELV